MGHTQTPIQWVPGLFRDTESAGAWNWALTPSTAEIKNKWRCASTPLIWLRGIDGETFTFAVP